MPIGATITGRRGFLPGLIGAAVLFPSALTAHAAAATLTVDRPCFVDVGTAAAQMVVVGTGFTGGDTIAITSSDGSVDTTTTAAPNGAISVTTGAPVLSFTRPGDKTVTLTAQDITTAGTPPPQTPVTVTTLAALPTPTSAPLTKKVTWDFSGFQPGTYIYGHYLRKHQVARARFGRASGPCGLLQVRARFYPGGHPRYSQYKIQFDDSKRYSSHSLPRLVVGITRRII